ncbi:MAG: von Willebrand factor type A domain-containing protein [Pirellulales bacterium]|nr:von Willebrand factor type A domain-containing protein [Pirellulales bacterium]
MSSSADWIDAELNSLPVPEDVLARLREVGTFSDADLDAALRGVRPRLLLRDRLLAIGTGTDGDLDDELRAVAVPADLLDRCQMIPLETPSTRAIHAPKWRRVVWAALAAAAAILVMALTRGQFPREWGQLADRWLGPAGRNLAHHPDGPPVFDPKNKEPLPGIPGDLPSPPGGASSSDLAQQGDDSPDFSGLENQIPAGDPWPLPKLPVESPIAFSPVPVTPDSSGGAPAMSAAPSVPTANPGNPTGILGNQPGFGTTGDLISVTEPQPRGVLPPRVREYDLMFQLRQGVHPFVAPAAHAALASSQVPLITSDTSYQAAWRALRQKQLPSAASIRVEDFLAAMDYEFAPPSQGNLALRTAAGRAPWHPANIRLLQIGVQTASTPRITTTPAHLIWVVDLRAIRLRRDRESLLLATWQKINSELSAQDHISVIGFDQQAQVLAERLSPADFAIWLDRALAQQFNAPGGIWNFSPAPLPTGKEVPATTSRLGFVQAVLAAQRVSGADVTSRSSNFDAQATTDSTPRVLLVTGGNWQLGNGTNPDMAEFSAAEQAVRELVTRGGSWRVVDLRPADALDPVLTHLASWNTPLAENSPQLAPPPAVVVEHPATVRELSSICRAAITGKSQIAARHVSLRIKFDPRSVALYRLIGHEATALASLTPPPLEVDLLSGDTATALYEVVLQPDGPAQIAVAELQWKDDQGETHTQVQPVTRRQFAISFNESPWSLQLAAFAAETAEILRGSYFTPAGAHDWQQLREVAARMSPRLRNKDSLRQLEQLWRAVLAAEK